MKKYFFMFAAAMMLAGSVLTSCEKTDDMEIVDTPDFNEHQGGAAK